MIVQRSTHFLEVEILCSKLGYVLAAESRVRYEGHSHYSLS